VGGSTVYRTKRRFVLGNLEAALSEEPRPGALIHPNIAAAYGRSTVKGGDILFSIVGYLGQTAIVPDKLNGANITQTTARIAIKSAHHNKYFLQQFRSLGRVVAKHIFEHCIEAWRILHEAIRCPAFVENHLREGHHGPAFWEALSWAMPDWQKRKDALASQAKEYLVFGLSA
jgi:hypothetical protein